MIFYQMMTSILWWIHWTWKQISSSKYFRSCNPHPKPDLVICFGALLLKITVIELIQEQAASGVYILLLSKFVMSHFGNGWEWQAYLWWCPTFREIFPLLSQERIRRASTKPFGSLWGLLPSQLRCMHFTSICRYSALPYWKAGSAKNNSPKKCWKNKIIYSSILSKSTKMKSKGNQWQNHQKTFSR